MHLHSVDLYRHPCDVSAWYMVHGTWYAARPTRFPNLVKSSSMVNQSQHASHVQGGRLDEVSIWFLTQLHVRRS